MMDESKYFEDLTTNDLKYLLKIYDRRIKILKSEYQRKKSLSDDEVKTEIQQLARDFIIRLGFVQNDFYVTEVTCLARKFYEEYDWKSRHGAYTNELLASVLVSIVLDKYGAKFDLDVFLDGYELKRDEYFRLKNIISNWCLDNYWLY